MEDIYDEQKNQIERTLTKIKQVFYTKPVHFKQILNFRTATLSQLRLKLTEFDQKEEKLRKFTTTPKISIKSRK